MPYTGEEMTLINKFRSGVYDGMVGTPFTTTGGSVIWTTVKNGIATRYKQGPGGRFFNGKENEIFSGSVHKLQEYISDEEVLEFLRKFGWLKKDAAARAYSARYKR